MRSDKQQPLPRPAKPEPSPRPGPIPRTFQPAGVFILLRNGVWLATAAVALVLALSIGPPRWLPISPGAAVLIAAIALMALLLWNALVRRAERYTLTRKSVIWESGVLHRVRVEAPIERIQNTVLSRSPVERVFGVGTLGVATAGTEGYEIVWRSIASPGEVMALLNETVAEARAHVAMSTPEVVGGGTGAPARVPRQTSLPVIGLAGGVGSGKSTVAGVFAELGCLVIDSDRRARAALDRPEVRDQLAAWWGPAILGPDGRVDRARVSDIVFADPEQRRRLEGLVHPIVRQDRAGMIAEAAAAGGVRAVVIDAPLLFEAGLDRECDAVIFVDAPEAQRLERVRQARGWDEAELRRREAAQMSLEEKRSRATVVIPNNGDVAALRAAAAAALDRVIPPSG